MRAHEAESLLRRRRRGLTAALLASLTAAVVASVSLLSLLPGPGALLGTQRRAARIGPKRADQQLDSMPPFPIPLPPPDGGHAAGRRAHRLASKLAEEPPRLSPAAKALAAADARQEFDAWLHAWHHAHPEASMREEQAAWLSRLIEISRMAQWEVRQKRHMASEVQQPNTAPANGGPAMGVEAGAGTPSNKKQKIAPTPGEATPHGDRVEADVERGDNDVERKPFHFVVVGDQEQEANRQTPPAPVEGSAEWARERAGATGEADVVPAQPRVRSPSPDAARDSDRGEQEEGESSKHADKETEEIVDEAKGADTAAGKVGRRDVAGAHTGGGRGLANSGEDRTQDTKTPAANRKGDTKGAVEVGVGRDKSEEQSSASEHEEVKGMESEDMETVGSVKDKVKRREVEKEAKRGEEAMDEEFPAAQDGSKVDGVDKPVDRVQEEEKEEEEEDAAAAEAHAQQEKDVVAAIVDNIAEQRGEESIQRGVPEPPKTRARSDIEEHKRYWSHEYDVSREPCAPATFWMEGSIDPRPRCQKAAPVRPHAEVGQPAAESEAVAAPTVLGLPDGPPDFNGQDAVVARHAFMGFAPTDLEERGGESRGSFTVVSKRSGFDDEGEVQLAIYGPAGSPFSCTLRGYRKLSGDFAGNSVATGFAETYDGEGVATTGPISPGVANEYDILTCRDLADGEVQHFRFSWGSQGYADLTNNGPVPVVGPHTGMRTDAEGFGGGLTWEDSKALEGYSALDYDPNIYVESVG